MYTLYGTRRSGAASTELALKRCGVAYEVIDAASWKPKSAVDELARANPLRQIPTLILPDGSVMTESAAILIHLGLAFPKSGLLSTRRTVRAQQIRGLVFIAANCYSAISIRDYPARWTTATGKQEMERLREGTKRRLHRHWEIFADTFPATPWLSGREPGALDYLAVVVSKWAGTRSHLAKARPDFHKLLLRIETHASARKVIEAHFGK